MEKAVEFMDSYSINMDDFDTIVEISKFQVGVVIERFSCIFHARNSSLYVKNGFLGIGASKSFGRDTASC